MGCNFRSGIDHLASLTLPHSTAHHTRLTIQVLRMRVEAPGVLQAGLESEFAVLSEPWAPKVQAAGHHSDIALSQSIVDYIFILLHLKYREAGVHGWRELCSLQGQT